MVTDLSLKHPTCRVFMWTKVKETLPVNIKTFTFVLLLVFLDVTVPPIPYPTNIKGIIEISNNLSIDIVLNSICLPFYIV